MASRATASSCARVAPSRACWDMPCKVAGDVATLWRGFDDGLRTLGAEPGLDILVNNAAIPRSNALGAVTPEEFGTLFAVNVKAPFFIVQQGLARIRDGGRIINISSNVTRIATPDIIAYLMTKGALNTFSLTIARALGARGITVNSGSPGIVDTDANAAWLRGDPRAWATRPRTAMG